MNDIFSLCMYMEKGKLYGKLLDVMWKMVLSKSS